MNDRFLSCEWLYCLNTGVFGQADVVNKLPPSICMIHSSTCLDTSWCHLDTEIFSTWLKLLCAESTSFYSFFAVSLNKLLKKVDLSVIWETLYLRTTQWMWRGYEKLSLNQLMGIHYESNQKVNISFRVLGCFCFSCSVTIGRQIWLIV